MSEVIYLRELECYKNASEEKKKNPLMSPNRFFDLSKIKNNNVANEMKSFILHRGQILSPLSIREDLCEYNLLCKFLDTDGSYIETFKNVDKDDAKKKMKKWLLKNGKRLTNLQHRTDTGKQKVSEAGVIKYLNKIIVFMNEEDKTYNFDSDKWYTDYIPLTLKVNSVNKAKVISFEKILQNEIKVEVKKVIYMHLKYYALGTVMLEITAINKFSLFLYNNYPDIYSLKNIDRNIIESYLIYINSGENRKKTVNKELYHLKRVLLTANKILEAHTETLFYEDDIAKNPSRLYKVYSEQEVKRLNDAIIKGDPQIARLFILHQLLGTRISETLTLKRDAIYKSSDGNWMIRIHQIKTGRDYCKAINADIKMLFDKACEYTTEKYGKREYVFVRDKNPDEPMQYARVKYSFMAMVTQNNLVDDNGNKFGFGTHIWRHNYGKNLTELHIDDVLIAKLLGHTNTSNLKYYRKIGDSMLRDETSKTRQNYDDIIKDITKDW